MAFCCLAIGGIVLLKHSLGDFMNLGWTEILLIGGIALLLFGPSKLPNLGRSLGESIRGFKKALTEDPQEEKVVTHEKIAQNPQAPLSEQVVTEEEKDKKHQS